MVRSRLIIIHVVLAFFAIMPALGFARAQGTSASSASTEKQNQGIFKNLKFRDLGPTVAGGRVTAIEGIPGNPNGY